MPASLEHLARGPGNGNACMLDLLTIAAQLFPLAILPEEITYL